MYVQKVTHSIPSSVEPLDQLPPRKFHRIKADDGKMNDLRKIFENILVPLYGPQEEAINKIAQGKDRICYLLYETNRPVGVIAFKSHPSDEFATFGIDKSFEIKSLFVVDSENNSGRGLGTTLLNKVIKKINKLKIEYNSVHVTVSKTKNESLNFFKRKGFRIMHEWEGKYKDNTVEYLLACPYEALNAADKQPTSAPSSSQPGEQKHQPKLEEKHLSTKCLFVVNNAHWDDIHALKLLSDGTFISGSKDNSLCKWNQNGELVRVINEVEPRGVHAEDWITAIGVVNDAYWVSGERNGRVALWTTAGDYVKEIKLKLPKFGHFSLPENTRRVTCLATNKNTQKPGFFIGFPTMFDEYNFIEGKTSTLTKVHNNDWVYCLHPLTDTSILAVTGCTLQLWKQSNDQWNLEKPLVLEGKRRKGQRPYISSLIPLLGSSNQFLLGSFDGSVKSYDISSGKIVRRWNEHTEKVWAIENVDANIFASSSADKTIKLWDARQSASLTTLGNHVGEVSTLLRLKENTLVAGTCPKDPIGKNDGAQLLFYDVRK